MSGVLVRVRGVVMVVVINGLSAERTAWYVLDEAWRETESVVPLDSDYGDTRW
jgi:hypothetical protein